MLELRWAAAGALPEANRALLSPAEVAFADGYDLVLAAYMEAVGSGLDLTNGASPPKDLCARTPRAQPRPSRTFPSRALTERRRRRVPPRLGAFPQLRGGARRA